MVLVEEKALQIQRLALGHSSLVHVQLLSREVSLPFLSCLCLRRSHSCSPSEAGLDFSPKPRTVIDGVVVELQVLEQAGRFPNLVRSLPTSLPLAAGSDLCAPTVIHSRDRQTPRGEQLGPPPAHSASQAGLQRSSRGPSKQ